VIVAIHQPQYLPWLPYCAKAAGCDTFVYLDTVQYQKNGVQNRNQIKTNAGAIWLTVPVRAHLGQTISETRIADQRWARKHILSIQQHYARAPFRSLFNEGLRPLLERPWGFLADLNVAVTDWLFDCLGISCRSVRASELNATGAKDDLVIDICQKLGATVYLSGPGARCYQDEAKFKASGVELRYHEYRSGSYPQCHPAAGFVPALSALDLVLNTGPHAHTVMLAEADAPEPTE
jgi:hypothetical protein